MRLLLERYVAGERMADLLRKEFTEFSSSRLVLSFVRSAQLSGLYVKEFNIPELEIKGLKIPIPQIPEVISEELAARVHARSEHRRKWNKENRRKYVLTGFIRCGHCETALTGNTTGGRHYYRHCTYEKWTPCVFHSIRGEELVDPVLDYLFAFFTDEKIFNEAVSRALPDASERESLERERDSASKRLSTTEKEIARLVEALVKGADAALLIGKQKELKERREHEANQLAALVQRIATMPDQETMQREALEVRLRLLQKVRQRDWRKLPFDEINQFLIFLFGENPHKSGNGIKVTQEKGRWRIAFRGKLEFHHEIINGRPVSHLMRAEAGRHNKHFRGLLERVNLTRQT